MNSITAGATTAAAADTFGITDPILFVIGLVVTAVTLVAILSIGLSEANDPAHNRLSTPPRSEAPPPGTPASSRG